MSSEKHKVMLGLNLSLLTSSYELISLVKKLKTRILADHLHKTLACLLSRQLLSFALVFCNNLGGCLNLPVYVT